MKIDLVTCNPRQVDYPLFRHNLLFMYQYFNQVFIVLTQGNRPDISEWLTKAKEYSKVRFLKQPPTDGKSDWRNLAMNEALIHSKSDYILFMEQDFLLKNEKMLEFINKYDRQFLGFMEGERIHPAFSLVKRDLIDKTSKDFSANPPYYDHFGKFFQEIKKLTDMRFLEEFSFEKRKDWYHLNGLTQNYHCFKEGQPFYRKEEFLTYNHGCLMLPIDHNPDFKPLMEGIDKTFGLGDIKSITNFFPKEVKNSGTV